MKTNGVLGNFTDVNALVKAAEELRQSGYTEFDCYTPYPVHGLDAAMGVKRTILPYITFTAGTIGLMTALFLQSTMIWTGGEYVLNIGGKPMFALQFSIPIDFELTVLFSALSTVFGLFHLCKLPTWFHPFQNDKGFQKATDDLFVVGVMATDPKFNEEQVKALLSKVGAADVRVVTEEESTSVAESQVATA